MILYLEESLCFIWMSSIYNANTIFETENGNGSSDKIDFTKPIPAGTIIEIIGNVIKVGNTSIQVKVEIFVEEMYYEKREKAIEGIFTLVAIGEDKRSVKVI